MERGEGRRVTSREGRKRRERRVGKGIVERESRRMDMRERRAG